jgi:hypothetical protein
MEEAQILEKRKTYKAIGTISGILELTKDVYSSLIVGEHNYCVMVSRRVAGEHQPGKLQGFKVYPSTIEDKLGFSLRRVIGKAPRKSKMVLKGLWTMYEQEPRLIIRRNGKGKDAQTVLKLMWEESPVADGKYWEIEAEVKKGNLIVIGAIGPFDPPRKLHEENTQEEPIEIKSELPPLILEITKSAAKSDLPRPILKSAEPIEIKSELPPPTLKSSKTSIAAIKPPEAEAIAESTSEPIALNASQAIEDLNIATKSAEAIKPIAANEIKAIAETTREPIEPEESEASPVVAEPVTPKTKKASGKSSALEKLSISPETAEPKKTKEKVKASSSKKPMSLAADRLFLGKQLPPGK